MGLDEHGELGAHENAVHRDLRGEEGVLPLGLGASQDFAKTRARYGDDGRWRGEEEKRES